MSQGIGKILSLCLAKVEEVEIVETSAYDNDAIFWYEQGAKAQKEAIIKAIGGK